MTDSTLAGSDDLRAVAEEQTFLTAAHERRRAVLQEATRRLARPPRDAAEAGHHQLLEGRRSALEQATDGLVLGRIDTDSGDHLRIGRIGLADESGDQLVLDWRAGAARPFYTATALHREGVARRRHIRTRGTRVLGVDDEDLAAGGTDQGLVGEAALLAALDEGRTGRMGTAVATLQREQDTIVRSQADEPVVVQGGPGTGKTVVALHRVAYLLFAHPEIARRGVLLLGPSDRFLRYVAQVLPALGETAIVSTTCEALLPGARPEREESRDVAEIKGRACWWPALQRVVAELVPQPRDLELVLDGERLTLAGDRVAAAQRAALAGGRGLLGARLIAVDGLRDALLDVVLERGQQLLSSMEEGYEDVLGTLDAALARSDELGARTRGRSAAVDGELSATDLEDLREQIASDTAVTAVLVRWWPEPEARTVLTDLLHDRRALRRHLPELSDAEIEAVAAEPTGLSPSDLPLLDALVGLLDAVEPASPDEPFLAGRAAADPGWTYGHVVVDEAQELSPMQWRMVRRRCPVGSVTAVGDIDQAEAPHRATSWEALLGDALGTRWRRADLTICYRTPREVMALTPPVLARAGSTNEPPRAVRSTGRDPIEIDVAAPDMLDRVAEEVASLGRRHPAGTVGVVAADSWCPPLAAGLPGTPVLTARAAKGLEWDACVVVDPEAIGAGPRGWNALYVALTRCTQDLALLRPC